MADRKRLHSIVGIATGGSPRTRPSSASGECKKGSVPGLLDGTYLKTHVVLSPGNAGMVAAAWNLATLKQKVDR